MPHRAPTTPAMHRYNAGLGSSPVARHYWGNHCLFSLPPGTKMFQFPGLASRNKKTGCMPFRHAGCPIRKSPDQWSFAPTRGLSQLITSFIASVSQGIHLAPFLTFSVSVIQETLPSGKKPSGCLPYNRRSYFQLLLKFFFEKIEFYYSLSCRNMSKIA